MAEARPRSIRYFEVLTFTSFAIGAIHQLVVTDIGLARAIFGAAVPVALALVASRGRKNWARWLLAVMFVVGAGLIILGMQAVLSFGYPFVTFLVILLQAVSLAFLFTQESSDWLRHKPSLTDTFS